MKSPSPEQSIFILHMVEEMRHPYDSALKPFCRAVRWFTSQPSLVAAAQQEQPAVVIVDLDALERPLTTAFESLRAAFPASELIAISAEDSAKLATQCIHNGFSDFLLKPTSPEELAWSIRKSSQRHEILTQLNDPRTELIRAAGQLSSSATPSLVRLNALESLQKLLHAKGGAWISRASKLTLPERILCAVPRGIVGTTVEKQLTQKVLRRTVRSRVQVILGKSTLRKVVLPCDLNTHQAIVLWGISTAPASSVLDDAQFLLKHAELALLNLQRFDEIKQQTFMDDLTGLYNSRYLKYALTNAVLKCREPGQAFSILFIDVDHFKSVNDKHGHMVGSEFLVAIGKTVRNAVRSIDPVFRYGGDEFVVILHDSDTSAAKVIAERIRKNIERRVFVIHGQKIQTTVSVGLATFPHHAADQETILKLADEAMYSAKKTSRNSVHLALGLEQPAPEKIRRAS